MGKTTHTLVTDSPFGSPTVFTRSDGTLDVQKSSALFDSAGETIGNVETLGQAVQLAELRLGVNVTGIKSK